MKSYDHDDHALNYEKYYGSAPILSARFAVGIFTEFLGTFVIHFFGLLACLLHSNDNYDVNAFFVGCAFGGSYLFVSEILQKVSSCHFNPSFSLCSCFFGNISIIYCVVATLAQILSVTAATSFLYLILHKEYDILYVTVFKPEGITTLSMLGAEFLGSLLIINCRMVTVLDSLQNYYTALSIVLAMSVFIPFSGGALNPARAVGSCVITLNTIPDYYWVYWLGPVGAAFLSILLFFTGVLHKSNQ
ncbi:hypothetical protein ACHWQZ_G004216 [Mnemiopsis leidyi]